MKKDIKTCLNNFLFAVSANTFKTGDNIYEAVERHEYIKTHIEECIKNYEGFKSRLNL